MGAVTKTYEEIKLQKALAFEVAKDYCKKNNLSLEKLKDQRIEIIKSTLFFSQSRNIQPDGLKNDLDTMPIPTLIITTDGDGLKIEQTEYTKKYLSM